MTLLVTAAAAVISTAIWYKNASKRSGNTGVLCLIYWGASLMWLVDMIFGCAELGTAYFTPGPEKMLSECCLGLLVVALGLGIWFVVTAGKRKKVLSK